jgi:hypothetical protein
MNSARILVRLSAALLVAGIVNACTGDRGAARSVAGPFASADVVEGANVHGRLTRTFRQLGPGGAVRAESAVTEEFDAPVERGRARIDRGPLVALTAPKPVPGRPAAFTDSAGHRHEIEFEAGAPGEPLRGVRALIDGQQFAHVEFAWRRTGHGFVLAHRAATFFARDGSAVASEDISVDATEVASAESPKRRAASLAAILGAVVLPAPLMAEMVDCFSANFYYMGASLGVAVGIVAVLGMPYNPKAWLGLIGAIKVWDATLEDAMACWIQWGWI